MKELLVIAGVVVSSILFVSTYDIVDDPKMVFSIKLSLGLAKVIR